MVRVTNRSAVIIICNTLGEPEVGDIRDSILDQDVCGFNIPVINFLRVRIRNSIKETSKPRGDLLDIFDVKLALDTVFKIGLEIHIGDGEHKYADRMINRIFCMKQVSRDMVMAELLHIVDQFFGVAAILPEVEMFTSIRQSTILAPHPPHQTSLYPARGLMRPNSQLLVDWSLNG